MGKLFIILCENKFSIDSKIYKKIISLKDDFQDGIRSFDILFLKNKILIKNRKIISSKTDEIIAILNDKILEFEDFIN